MAAHECDCGKPDDPNRPHSQYPMMDVDDAVKLVLTNAKPLPTSKVSLAECHGHVVAEDVVAPAPQPPFRASIKDGYAVVSSDGPGVYPVVNRSVAGPSNSFVLQPGQVCYITTGAVVPEGADAVVQVEDTEPIGTDMTSASKAKEIRVCKQVPSGYDIRPVGCDMKAGQLVLPKGTALNSAEVGIIASLGLSSVQVHGRPRVGVFSTGDELVDAGQTPGPGQICDSNRPMLLAAIKALGYEAIDLGKAADTNDGVEGLVIAALPRVDVLITSGGVSMGDLDLVKPYFEKAGKVHFGRIKMKPGKPATFATVPSPSGSSNDRLVFALPGNPVSSMVTFHLLVSPALRALTGRTHADSHLPTVTARTTVDLKLDPDRPEYHRVTLHRGTSGDGIYDAVTTGLQASSRLMSMVSASALALLPQRL